MEERYLGKITEANYGLGSDRDFTFGLQLSFSFDGKGADDPYHLINMEDPGPYHNFNLEEQNRVIVKESRFLYRLLKDAKCRYVSELVNKPVEVTVDGHLLKSFRILTEVL